MSKFAGKGGSVTFDGTAKDANSWSVEYNSDVAEVTTFESADEWKEFISGQTSWTATVDAYLTTSGGLISELGSDVTLLLYLTATETVGGDGFITSFSTSQDNNGAVTVTYQIQGTSALS